MSARFGSRWSKGDRDKIGGEVGEWYKVACKITTNMGRIDERTLHIFIENK